MTKTVCIASTNPKPNQIDTFHIHWCDCVRCSSCAYRDRSLPLDPKSQECSESPEACSGRSSPLTNPDGYYSHAHHSEDHPVPCIGSICNGRLPTKCGGPESVIYQRLSTQVPGALSGLGVPDFRVRHELQPSYADGRPPYVRQCLCKS
jgi:hypothetical protein